MSICVCKIKEKGNQNKKREKSFHFFGFTGSPHPLKSPGTL
jgi:hypothetical protein